MVGESVSRRHEMPDEDVAEDDYRSFCDALGSTARGRAFLDEFARRNRQADTEVVLAALDRLEATARAKSSASPEADRIRQDLRALLDTLRSARPQTENSPSAIKAATLAALIDFVQARIEALVLPAREDDSLSAVPVEEQPELPIPHPAAAAPLMTLVQTPIRIEAPQAVAAVPMPAAHAKRKTATIIPIVEFDYRAHLGGRTTPHRYEPEESWTTLAPPAVAAPPMPDKTEPQEIAQQLDAVKPEVEPYELWLDPPVIESNEPVTAELAPSPLMSDAAEAKRMVSGVEAMLDRAIAEAAILTLPIEEPPVIAAPAAPEAPTLEQPAFIEAEASISTIEALMQQMEQASPPPPALKAHAADPLAPLMALSEEERIALFT